MKKILIILIFSHLFSTGQQTIIYYMDLWDGDEMKWVNIIIGEDSQIFKSTYKMKDLMYILYSVGPISSNWDRQLKHIIK